MTQSWRRAIDALAADPEVRVVVVTGAGTAFCSGGDPRWIAGEPDASVDRLRTRMIAFYRDWLAIRELERSEENTSELQSLMRTSYAVLCLNQQKQSENI